MSLQITPDNPSVALGLARQLSVLGTFSDGTTRFLTGSVQWSSSDLTIATFSANPTEAGLVATHAAGNVSVSATLDGVTASTTLTVSAPELVSIDVTPASVSIPVGTTRQLAATGVFSDGSTQDLTTSATWEAAPAAVATINAGGLATGVALEAHPSRRPTTASVGLPS